MKKYLIAAAAAFALFILAFPGGQAVAQAPWELCSIGSYGPTPAVVGVGSTTTLHWSTSNCDSHYTIVRTPAGGPAVTTSVFGLSWTTPPITVATTFKLIANQVDGGGYSTNSTITVTPTLPCTINYFNATPASITAGTSSSLTWSTTNCTSISISGGGMAGSQPASSTGLTTGNLFATTTYTLNVSNDAGSTYYATTVTVGGGATCAASAASPSNELHGYAWSSTIGWIGFNCADVASPTTNYRVSVDPTNGNFSGAGWSSNVGWVSFNAADTAICGAPAKIDFTNNQISGWARVLSHQVASGADGCISLRGSTTSAYGVSYNPGVTTPVVVGTTIMPGYPVTGFAWGDVNQGWINFNYATLDADYTGPTVDLKFESAGIPITDGPVTMPESTGGPATLSWVADGVTTCTADPDYRIDGAWAGTKAIPSGSTAIVIPPNTGLTTVTYIFGITCAPVLAGSDPVTDIVVVNVPPSATTTVNVTLADIDLNFVITKVNGVAIAPTILRTVKANDNVTLSWTTHNLTSCVGTSTSGSGMFATWTGITPASTKPSVPDGTYSSPAITITTPSTFTLSCVGTDGTTITRTVTVNIETSTGGGGAGGGPIRPPWQEF